jgi:hypothetical protein
MNVKMNASEIRSPEFTVNKVFLNRWSPRAMSGEPISEGAVLSEAQKKWYSEAPIQSMASQ